MARGYNATLEVKCWKEHTCCYCGATYRYLLHKRQTGHGASQPEAVGAARTAAVRALRGSLQMMPCPSCGHFQPDMIGARRLRRHAVVFLVTTTLFVTMFLLSSWYVVPGAAALWLLFGGAVIAWIAYTWIGARNPNSSIRANKLRAERLVGQKRLFTVTAEKEGDDKPRPVVIETGAGFWFVFLCLGATAALMPGAEVIRAGSGWPSNPDWHPPIVGPGDKAWVWLNPEEQIESLNGAWRATGSGQIVDKQNNANQGDKKDEKNEVKVTSRDGPWGDLSSASGTAPVRLWARVLIPDHHQLRHKEVELKLTLHVVWPETSEGKNERVVEKHKDVTVPVTVKLARPFAGFLYEFFWSIAVLGGGAMFLLAGGYHLMSDLALKKSAPPTRVIALTEEESTEPAAAPAPARGDGAG